METIRFVYMTAGSREEAFAIGEALVAEKLAACINVIDPMYSIFEWKGEIQHDTEAVMIAKTTEAKLAELVAAVKAKHSYECPCVVSLPASGGNEDFLEWIRQTVAPA
jgi:periplasmic divalent cation tolerance protein